MRWSVGAAPRSHRGPTHGPSSRGRRPPTLPPSPSPAPRLSPPLASSRLSPLASSRLPPPLASRLLPLASGGAAGIRTELEPIDSTPGGAPAERARGTGGAASERPRDARATESFALVSPLPPIPSETRDPRWPSRPRCSSCLRSSRGDGRRRRARRRGRRRRAAAVPLFARSVGARVPRAGHLRGKGARRLDGRAGDAIAVRRRHQPPRRRRNCRSAGVH